MSFLQFLSIGYGLLSAMSIVIVLCFLHANHGRRAIMMRSPLDVVVPVAVAFLASFVVVLVASQLAS